jgi:hypothetical protein
LPSRPVQQIEHAELVSPAVEEFVIQRGSLQFEHRESIFPLAIGDFVLELIPNQLVQYGILGACEANVQLAFRCVELLSVGPRKLFARPRVVSRDEDIGLEHGAKVNDVERRPPSDRVGDHAGIDVELTAQRSGERFSM